MHTLLSRCVPTLGVCLLLSSTGCGATPGVVPSDLSAISKQGTSAIDEARCEGERARLRPFTVGWDATNLAEFSGHVATSIAFFRVEGCQLELVPECRVPGRYAQQAVTASDQTVKLSSQEELYLQIPLSVAALSASLARHGALELDYTVRSMRYASTPALFRSQLPDACETVTHFAVNYAEGAYALQTSAASDVGGKVDVSPADGGAQAVSSASSLFRSGTLADCRQAGTGCDAPVRLRLSAVRTGSPPAAVDQASRLAVTQPAPRARAGSLSPEESAAETTIPQSFALGRIGWQDCLDTEIIAGGKWPQGPQSGIRLKTRFTLNPDGTVADMTLDDVTEGTPAAFLGCFRSVFRSLRFEPPKGGDALQVSYPIVFTP